MLFLLLKHSRELILPLHDHDRGPGDTCSSDDDCNCKSNVMHNSLLHLTCCEGGIKCHHNGTVCGGFGAYLNVQELEGTGLDVGRDYCLSGGLSLHKERNVMTYVPACCRKNLRKQGRAFPMPRWSSDGVNNPTTQAPDSTHCWTFGGWYYCLSGRYYIYTLAETTTEQVKTNGELGSGQ